MIFFAIPGSAGYGSRIFIQQYQFVDQINEVIGLHELASKLSHWQGADKRVSMKKQFVKGGGGVGDDGICVPECVCLGYEMEDEEIAVLVKRCKRRGLQNVSEHLVSLVMDWS